MPEQVNDIMHEVIQRLTRIETKLDLAVPQIENHENRIRELEPVKQQVEDHETRIRELEGKGGKRWDAVTMALITAVLAAVVGYVLGKIL